jgi:hypothetical protein
MGWLGLGFVWLNSGWAQLGLAKALIHHLFLPSRTNQQTVLQFSENI